MTDLALSTLNGPAGVSGTPAANQIAYWVSASSIAGDAGLTYDAANDDLTVAGAYRTSSEGSVSDCPISVRLPGTGLYTTTTGTRLYVARNGSTEMFFDENNNVGIGGVLSNLGAKLHVTKAGNPPGDLPTFHSRVGLFQRTDATGSDAYIIIASGDTATAGFHLGDLTSCTQGSILYSNNLNRMDFYTSGALAMQIDSTGSVGINDSTPDAKLHVVQSNASGAMPVLELHQDDIDEPFIEFDGASAGDLTSPITTLAGGAVTEHVRVSINGTDRWIPLVTTPA